MKRLAVCCVGLFLAIIVLGCSTEPAVTMAKYNQVTTGMSYADVVSVMGTDGSEMSRLEMSGITTVSYSWQNADGSNMIVMLQDDKVVSKAQAGLK